jgi:hypothetical protein
VKLRIAQDLLERSENADNQFFKIDRADGEYLKGKSDLGYK